MLLKEIIVLNKLDARIDVFDVEIGDKILCMVSGDLGLDTDEHGFIYLSDDNIRGFRLLQRSEIHENT